MKSIFSQREHGFRYRKNLIDQGLCINCREMNDTPQRMVCTKCSEKKKVLNHKLYDKKHIGYKSKKNANTLLKHKHKKKVAKKNSNVSN